MCWYQGITEKVKAQLSGWAASSLSMAGRAVLVNLAESLEEEGGSVFARIFFFLWGPGHTSSQSKIHSSSSSIDMRPSLRGGLGLD